MSQIKLGKINIIDVLLFCYVITVVLNICYIEHGDFSIIVIAKWFAMSSCYMFMRGIANKQVILWLIIIGGLIEALVVFAQKIQWLDSNHRSFEVTGTFGNPGQLGGFLAIALVMSFALFLLYWKECNRCYWMSLLIITLCIFSALILSDSRAGWLAALIGVCFYKRKNKISLTYRLGIVVLFVVLCIGGYFYKKDSADGRLFIWNITFHMISEKPFFGYGVDGFRKHYMHYQAKFFRNNENSEFKNIADNVIYPYNEFLHVCVEQGIISLLILIAIIISVFIYPTKGHIQEMLKSGSVALLIYSFFSYPSSVFTLCILYPLLLGCLDSKTIFVNYSKRYKFYVFSFILLGVIVSVRGYIFYIKSYEMSRLLFSIDNKKKEEANEFFFTNYKQGHLSFQMLDHYASFCFLEKKDDYLSILLNVSQLIPTCELFVDIGDAYMEAGKVGEAKKAYKLASEMIPCRILSKYKLFFVLYQEGDIVNMKKIGNDILKQEIKIVGTHVLKMKAMVRLIINKYP